MLLWIPDIIFSFEHWSSGKGADSSGTEVQLVSQEKPNNIMDSFYHVRFFFFSSYGSREWDMGIEHINTFEIESSLFTIFFVYLHIFISIYYDIY